MFIIVFLKIYFFILLKLAPFVGVLLLLIFILGWRIAKLEGWSFGRGMYCAFITATTVGYGVVHPTLPRTRFLSIIIAGTGLLFSGILVALAYHSLQLTAVYTGLEDIIRVHFPEFVTVEPL